MVDRIGGVERWVGGAVGRHRGDWYDHRVVQRRDCTRRRMTLTAHVWEVSVLLVSRGWSVEHVLLILGLVVDCGLTIQYEYEVRTKLQSQRVGVRVDRLDLIKIRVDRDVCQRRSGRTGGRNVG